MARNVPKLSEFALACRVFIIAEFLLIISLLPNNYNAISLETPKIPDSSIISPKLQLEISDFKLPDFDISTQKYLTYCPCMGRFGNQAEQMLGAISLAIGTNRSLLIPPFSLNDRANNTYSSIFDLETIQKILPGSMDLSTFMENYSEKYWPENTREMLCYRGAMKRSSDEKQCPYQFGEPFTTFWKQFDITFPKHRAIDDGGYMNFRPDFHAEFKKRFSDMKVMAFFGNPGAFPSIEKEQDMQKFIKFSPETDAKVREFIYRNMGAKDHHRPGTPHNHISENYIAIHARIGSDMENACKNHFNNVYKYHHEGKPDEARAHNLGTHYMGSAQCTGYTTAAKFVEKFTEKVCHPDYKSLAYDISLVLHKNPHIRRVFIGSDVPPKRVVAEVRSLMNSDRKLMKLVNFSFQGKPIEKPVSFHWLEPPLRDTMLDLAMMVNSEVFIGTCPSTFSAFVSRYRRFNGVGVFGSRRRSNPSFYFGMIEDDDHRRRMVADDRARRNDEL